jgi:hypothetical protein
MPGPGDTAQPLNVRIRSVSSADLVGLLIDLVGLALCELGEVERAERRFHQIDTGAARRLLA